jgi:hypothetical protein
LAGDIGLAGLTLGVERVELHVDAFLAGFTLAACRTEVYSMIANDDFACANVHRALDRVQSALFRS